MNLSYVIKICCVLWMTNSQLVSGLKCYECLHIDGKYNDPSCLKPGSTTSTARSAQNKMETVEEVALSMTPNNGSESSKRQYEQICVSFVGTFDGKNGASRWKSKSGGSTRCDKLATFITTDALGRVFIDGERCYCSTDLCNQGSRLGSIREQKWSFVLINFQLVYTMLVGSVR